MQRHLRVLMFSVVTLFAATSAHASPCGGPSAFPDVAQGDSFCSDVIWLRNANVTLGCGNGTNFCPGLPVTRGQMALFMQRLARATTPGIGFVESSTLDTGDLDTTGYQLCETPGVHGARTVANDRYWHGEGNVSIRTNGTADVQVRLTWSINGDPFQTAHERIPLVTVPANTWTTAHVMMGLGELIAPGNTYDFRLELFRAAGSSTTGELTDIRCQLKITTIPVPTISGGGS